MKIIIFTSEKSIQKPSGHTIDVVQWSSQNIDKTNLRDYDGIIFDMNNIPKDDPDFALAKFENVTISPEVVYDILKQQGSFIVIIGDPNAPIREQYISYRLGFSIDIVEGSGDSIATVQNDTQFYDYLTQIEQYHYSFRHEIKLNNEMKNVSFGVDDQDRRIIDVTNLLSTKAGYLIAARLDICTHKIYNGRLENRKTIFRSDLSLLPHIGGNSKKSIEAILNAFSDTVTVTEPDWASKISVVGQNEVDDKIVKNQEKLNKLNQNRTKLLSQREELRRSVEVLYKSDKPLEKSIKDYFQKIGIKVTEPEVTNKAEFSFEYDSKKFVVEVKSVAKEQIDQKGLRQVNDWRDDFLVNTGEQYKPVLIVSNQYSLPPDERSDNYLPDNLKNYAESKEIAVISVKDIFSSLQKVESGSSQLSDFISAIYDANGVVGIEKKVDNAQHSKTGK